MKDTVSKKISAFTFVFTVGIVMYHANESFTLETVDLTRFDGVLLQTYNMFCDHLGYVAMTFFFMMSGFLFYCSLRDASGTKDKMKRRVRSLLVPFLVWNATFVVWVKITTGSSPVGGLNTFLDGFFFAPLKGPLWYVLALLILMLPSPLIARLKGKRWGIGVLAAIIVVLYLWKGLGNDLPAWLDRWWWLGNMLTYTPAYLAGAAIGLYAPDAVRQATHERPRAYAAAVAVLLVAAVLLMLLAGKGTALEFPLYAVEVGALWMLFPSRWFTRKLRIFGSAFFIYALHRPLMLAKFETKMHVLLGDSTVYTCEVLLLKIVLVASVVLAAWGISELARAVLKPKVYALYTGGR